MNEMTDNEMEMLEAFLDEELGEQQRDEMRARLNSEPALAAELERLRGERQTRQTLFNSLEGGEEAVVDRIMANLVGPAVPDIAAKMSGTAGPTHRHVRRMLFAVAAAACIVLGFLIGWMGNTNGKSNVVAGEPPYRVEIV